MSKDKEKPPRGDNSEANLAREFIDSGPYYCTMGSQLRQMCLRIKVTSWRQSRAPARSGHVLLVFCTTTNACPRSHPSIFILFVQQSRQVYLVFLFFQMVASTGTKRPCSSCVLHHNQWVSTQASQHLYTFRATLPPSLSCVPFFFR